MATRRTKAGKKKSRVAAISPAQKSPPALASRSKALYLYGITQERNMHKRMPHYGVDGVSPVDALPCAGLTCWVSRVNKADFVDSLGRNMDNLEWLADAGVHHQRVISELRKRGTILPARFGTVFLSEDSLERHITQRKPGLLRSFKSLGEADEWGVKVFSLTRPTPELIEAKSGTDYLRQKSAAIKSQLQAGLKPHPLAPEVKRFAEKLQRLATDSTEGGKVSSGQAGLEWQTSILLPRRKQRDFEALINHYARTWKGRRRVECTGPWPPYSFVRNG